MKYEYKRIETDLDQLNELGLSGWRLVMKETITERNQEYDYYLLERVSNTREQSSSMNVSIEERKVNFIKEVEKYRSDYNQFTIAKFIEHWTDYEGDKMLFELEHKWNTKRRIATFKREVLK